MDLRSVATDQTDPMIAPVARSMDTKLPIGQRSRRACSISTEAADSAPHAATSISWHVCTSAGVAIRMKKDGSTGCMGTPCLKDFYHARPAGSTLTPHGKHGITAPVRSNRNRGGAMRNPVEKFLKERG